MANYGSLIIYLRYQNFKTNVYYVSFVLLTYVLKFHVSNLVAV